MSAKVSGYMNIVAYLQEVRKDGEPSVRVLMTDAEGFVGKDQFDCFPELKNGRHGMVSPTIPKVMKAIEQSRGKSAPATTKKTAPRRRRSSK